MDWVNFNYNLSHINNLLESTNTALEGKLQGKKAGDILFDFGKNVLSGGLRNEIAYDMKNRTGSDLGIAINDLAGYGSDAANKKGMQGLMQASIFETAMNNPFYGGMYGAGYPSMMGDYMGGYMGGYTGGYMSYPMSTPGWFGGMTGGMFPMTQTPPYFATGMEKFNQGFFA